MPALRPIITSPRTSSAAEADAVHSVDHVTYPRRGYISRGNVLGAALSGIRAAGAMRLKGGTFAPFSNRKFR
jgi:hypothetical protein